jgi:hypothetical protein
MYRTSGSSSQSTCQTNTNAAGLTQRSDIASIAQEHHAALVLKFLERLSDEASYAFALMAAAGSGGGSDRHLVLQARLVAFRSAFAA